MTEKTASGHKVIFTSRDIATAESRAKSEDNYLRVLNSYVQSMAVRDPAFFISMPSNFIEYFCQLAYEGEPVEGMPGRSAQLAERIGSANMEKLEQVGKGLMLTLTGMQSHKAEPIVRKNMLRELMLFHMSRMKRKEHPHAPKPPLGVRRRGNAYLDEDCFIIILHRKDIKGLVWDEETQTSRFRHYAFSDPVKVVGINLTAGHKWQHLRLQTLKTWQQECVDWVIEPKSSRCFYIRETRR